MSYGNIKLYQNTERNYSHILFYLKPTQSMITGAYVYCHEAIYQGIPDN